MTIAATFRQIEQTQSRNSKQEIFLKLLIEISNKSRLEAVRQRRRGGFGASALIVHNELD